jgi:hypothetical protein
MGNPTPATPVVRNPDGSISVLVYRSRTFRMVMVYEDLAYPPTGYKCRLGLTDKYGNALLASADSEDGAVTFSDATVLTNPATNLPYASGTAITAIIPDEDMGIEAKSGKIDVVLEDPAGHEDPIAVGDWLLWRDVSP